MAYSCVDGMVVDPVEATAEPRILAVDNGRIQQSVPAREEQSSAQVRLGSLFVMPGMIDLHTHVSYRNSNSPYEFGLARNLPEVTVDAAWNARLI